jgi:DNA-directed RNA polymerase subunit RPC12/RpoP
MTARLSDRRTVWGRKGLHLDDEATGFRCIHCRQYVSTARPLSGVGNRNHCPYCLHSRHLDWQRAGDRLAACKASMQPVGLTFKHINKRYGTVHGELMLVHRCTECGKLSINRIAADDDEETILAICLHSRTLDLRLRAEFEVAGIKTIKHSELIRVLGQLFGKN